MAQERVGRAVLELSTEGGSFYKGIEEARGQLRSLGQTIKQINSDSARMARGFSGRDSISEAVKLTNVIDRLGGVHRMTAANQARANTVLNEGAAAWQALGRSATPAYTRIQQYAAATQQAVAPTAALSQNMGLLAGAGFLVAQATEGVISAIANVGKESILTAARTQGLVAVAEYLGQKEGKTKGEVDELIASTNLQGITMQESANLVVQLGRAHLGLANAQKLATVAQNAAFISGMNSSDALDHIITGIITLQPRLLRTAGITVTFEQAELAAAKAMGRTVESLTAEEKQVIALNETLRAGAAIAGVYGLSMQYVGKQLTSLPRFIQDAETSVGEIFLPTLSVAVKTATDLLVVIRQYPKTFVALGMAVAGGAAVAGIFAGGMLGISAAVVAGGIAVLGLIGLIGNYIAKATDGTYASERFAKAADTTVDKLTTEQRELLKLAGTLHDAQLAQELVATATDRTSNQLSDQEKEVIQSQVTWNNWIDLVEEAWGRYKRLDFWTPVPFPKSALPQVPAAPDMKESLTRQQGIQQKGIVGPDGKPFWSPYQVHEQTGPLAPDVGGLLKEGRDLGAAQREVANANREFNAEVVKGGAVLRYLIEHIKQLYVGVDIDTAEKAIAARVGVSAATVRRLREDIDATNKELAKTPFAKFKDNLKQLGLDLKSDVGKLDDTLFKEEFGRRIEDATRDITRWGDQMKTSGVKIPAEVTAAMLRMNQIDLADWSRKEAADLATVTDSIKGLGSAVVETDDAIMAHVGQAISDRVDLTKDAAKTESDIANRRLEHGITMAKQDGANWQEVYALERQLATQRLAQQIAESNLEFKLRHDAMDKSTQAGIDAANDLRDVHALAVRQMVEDFNLSQVEILADLKHTHDYWTVTWDDMKRVVREVPMMVADGFASMLVGARTFKDGMLDIWHAIQRGIQQVLADLLNYFIHKFLTGLVKGIAGAKLGQTLGQALAGGATGAALGGGASAVTNLAGAGLAGLAGGGGAAAAGGLLAPTVAGSAASTAYAAGAFGAAGTTGAAAAGGGLGASLAAFATNPFTLAAVAAGVGGFLLYKHFRKGDKANDNRDKFLAQFSAFDTKRDDKNPRGFYGASSLLTKYKHHDWFNTLIGAKTPADVKKAEMPIVTFMATLGRQIKSYRWGGFTPPGATEVGILHGGARGELHIPLDSVRSSGRAVHVYQHNTVTVDASAIDTEGFGKLWDREAVPRLKHEFTFNNNRLASLVKRAIED